MQLFFEFSDFKVNHPSLFTKTVFERPHSLPWKEHFTNKEITTGLGTFNSKLYDLYKKHEIKTQGTTNSKRKGKNTIKHKEDAPTDPQQSYTTEPPQTLPLTIPMQDVPVIPKSEPTAVPSEPIKQIESPIPESFYIHYAELKSKQKVIHQLQSLATLLEESHEQYQFPIQIGTTF
ncbi:hypothetical protein [Bacillus toyonensis]|uniref:hypothetical protein n=1 Tax=Bacillus toyonensis TaxID=155322 RepID=UPI00211D4A6A|nr:hypothetical protein [Bacillus toyonensis]